MKLFSHFDLQSDVYLGGVQETGLWIRFPEESGPEYCEYWRLVGL